MKDRFFLITALHQKDDGTLWINNFTYYGKGIPKISMLKGMAMERSFSDLIGIININEVTEDDFLEFKDEN